MNTINRKSKEILLHTGHIEKGLFATVSKHAIYFNGAAVKLMGLEVGLYAHFLNEGSDWNFYVNDDPDGFKFTRISAKPGIHITSTGLSRMMMKSMGFSIEHSKQLKIEKTNSMHDRCEVYKLIS